MILFRFLYQNSFKVKEISSNGSWNLQWNGQEYFIKGTDRDYSISNLKQFDRISLRLWGEEKLLATFKEQNHLYLLLLPEFGLHMKQSIHFNLNFKHIKKVFKNS
jgi:hypothetical protein